MRIMRALKYWVMAPNIAHPTMSSRSQRQVAKRIQVRKWNRTIFLRKLKGQFGGVIRITSRRVASDISSQIIASGCQHTTRWFEMMKRLFWFSMGVLAGVFGWRYVKEKARDAASQITPAQVASDLYDGAVKLATQGAEIVRNLRAKDSSFVADQSDASRSNIK
jgi:hypothetical protein